MILPLSVKAGRLDLDRLIERLGTFGLNSLLVEGGGELAFSLLERKLVDKIEWIIAPRIIGGRTAKTSVEGAGVDDLKTAFGVEIDQVRCLGDDLLVTGYIRRD